MTISVKDCLQLGDLKYATVAAGNNGLDRIVKNVTVAEVFDAPSSLLYGGELVLTAFYSIKDDVERQCKFITKLNDCNVSGLVIFYLGTFLIQLDNKIIRLANELDFPLIIMPEKRVDFAYIGVIKPVTKAILSNNYRNKESQYLDLIDAVLDITNNLSNNLFNKNKKDEILNSALEILSERTNCSLILTDTLFRPQAWYLTSCIIQNMIENICEHCKLTYVNTSKDILNTYLIADSKIEPLMLCIIPVDIDKRNKFGFLIVVDDNDEKLADNVMLKNIVKPLKIVINIWKYEFENISESKYIEMLIEENYSKIDSFNQQIKQHLLLEKIDRLMLIKLIKYDFNKINASKIINALKIQFDAFNLINFIAMKEDNIIILTSVSSIKNYNLLLAQLSNILIEYLYKTFNAVSVIGVSGDIHNLEDVKKCFTDLNNNLIYSKIIFPQKKIFFDEDFSLTRLSLNIINSSKEYTETLINLIKPLKDYDEKYKTELYITLESLLLNPDDSLKLIADKLFIHENTLKYRLNRIEEILGYNPRKGFRQIETTLTIAISKILQYQSGNSNFLIDK